MLKVIRRRARHNLRIITWNCRGAFRKKAHHLTALNPDILIIQECETEQKWPDLNATSIQRIGRSPAQGLAVIAFGRWRSQPALDPPEDLDYFLPIHITGLTSLNLLGIWTKKTCPAGLSYAGQLREATARYRAWLGTAPAIVAGDWNANANWDRPDLGRQPFRDAVTTLQDAGLRSAYHVWNRAPFGDELQTTYTSNKGNHFHIDYCFIPQQWARSLRNVKVGGTDWANHSDHRPIIVDLTI